MPVSTLAGRSRSTFPALLLALCIMGWSPAASALEDEWTIGGGIVIASIPTSDPGVAGVGATAHARYGIIDALTLDIGISYSYHPGIPSADEMAEPAEDIHLAIPRVGLMLTLDVITVVPYLIADLTMYVADDTFFGDDADVPLGVGGLFGFGLSYQGWKDVSVGFELGYHAFFTDLETYPAYINVNVTASYRFIPW